MNELTLVNLPQAEMVQAIGALGDDQLDELIRLTDNAAFANRQARIERGRRHTDGRANLTPGIRLTQPELNRRSQERLVARYDPPVEEIKAHGWKKLVTKARAKKRESNVAAPALIVPADVKGDRWSALLGDFRDRLSMLPDGCVDLIVTDPPYDEAAVALYSDLAKEASRLLGPRGILFVMSGQFYLPELLTRLGEHLTYGWTWAFSLRQGGGNARIMGRHVNQLWKPVLAYSVGTWPSGGWEDDLMPLGSIDKDQHEWQQAPDGMQRLINNFAPNDGLVVDPFLGVGSFGVATLRTGRRFLGVEIDETRFSQSVTRLTEAE